MLETRIHSMTLEQLSETLYAVAKEASAPAAIILVAQEAISRLQRINQALERVDAKLGVAADDAKRDLAWTPKTADDLPVSFDEMLLSFFTTESVMRDAGRIYTEVRDLYDKKAVVYQNEHGVDSCFRRGLAGLFHNLMRKVDRIETVGIRLGISGGAAAVAAEAAADGEKDPETLYVTVRDLVVYGFHTLRWLLAEAASRAKVVPDEAPGPQLRLPPSEAPVEGEAVSDDVLGLLLKRKPQA